MGSSFSKLADKSFIIGFLIPALLFLAALRAAYGCPTWAASVCAQASGDLFKDLTLFAVCVWILAVLLVAANYVLYRVLEGYHLPRRWSVKLKQKWQTHVQNLVDREDSLRNARNKDGSLKTQAELIAQRQAASDIRWRRLREFPEKPTDAMATRFGNAVRAFELYSGAMYGASSIALWSLLLNVIPKEVGQRIDEARAQVDLFVNGCALACTFAVISAVESFLIAFETPKGGPATAVAQSAGLTTTAPNAWTAIIYALISMLVAWLCSQLAVGRVDSWGATVKGSFDCYLPALAAQLGYTLPASQAQRTAFWQGLSAQTVYRRLLIADEFWTRANPVSSVPLGARGNPGVPAPENHHPDDDENNNHN